MNIIDSFRLDGPVAVVTGGGKGIGEGIALVLADAGADLALVAGRAHCRADRQPAASRRHAMRAVS
jgi:NAD(P)-dependent dehydrogenase (short-subunit alcohol dehydrogenase family)